MTDSDVSQLSGEKLPQSDFPASSACEFRVFFEPDVHAAISSHASEDTSIEICGVVVGTWLKDDNGPFAKITNFIRCDDAASKNTEVTFTHQSWAQINEEMDSKYSDKRIIGWYHSHPDFGIFLSDRDMFIQEHFFSGPGQIAYVVDPVRKLEGVFEWRSGKAELIQRYWTGDRIIPVDAAKSDPPARPALTDSMQAASPGPAAPYVPDERDSPLSLVTTLLSALCLFLLGLLIGEWRTNTTQQMLSEGVVAHYGLWNIMQLGRSEHLNAVEQSVSKSFDDLTELSNQQTSQLEGEERAAVRKQFQIIRRTLLATRSELQEMQKRYNVSPEQRELMPTVIASHLGALSRFDTRQQLPVPVPQEFMEVLLEQMQEQADAAKKRSAAEQSASKKPSERTSETPASKSAKPPSSGTSAPNNALPPPIDPAAAAARQ